MSYTITQLAKLAKISTRTLRYYDEINLLKPLKIRTQGMRQYNKSHLLKLQIILLYRDMDMPLKEIKRIIDAKTFQQVQSLNFHRMRLQAQLSNIRQMINTVDKSIKHLSNEIPLEDIELFSGLQHSNQLELKKEMQQKLGKLGEKIIRAAESSAITKNVKILQADLNTVQQVFTDFLAIIEKGLAPDSDAAQMWVARYVKRVQQQVPNLSNAELMQMIQLETTDKKFKQRMDNLHADLADYFLQAATIFFNTE
jgi:DNA-binding transcriptional MerR regulator